VENEPRPDTQPPPIFSEVKWKIYSVDTQQLRLADAVGEACIYNRYFYSKGRVPMRARAHVSGVLTLSVRV